MSRPLTSPSNLLRRKLCPGSARMEAGIEPSQTDSADAAEGTMLHACMKDGTTPDTITGEQEWALGEARRLTAQAIEAVFGADSTPTTILEQTLYTPLEGTPDHVSFHGSYGLVLDNKFGRIEVEEAYDNLQLAAYALMAALEYNLTHVTVGIVQPRAPKECRLSLAYYHLARLSSIGLAIADIQAACDKPDAPLNAYEEACKYCTAKWNCPAYKATLDLPKVPEKQVINLLPDAELANFLRVIRAAQGPVGKEVVAEARRRATEGSEGWHLKPTGANRELTDAKQAFARFKARFEGVENIADLFLACGDFSVTKLEALACELQGAKKKDSREVLNQIIGDLIKLNDKAPSPSYESIPSSETGSARETFSS